MPFLLPHFFMCPHINSVNRGMPVMFFSECQCLNVQPVTQNSNGLLMSKSRPLYIVDVGNYPSKRLKINCCQLQHIMVSSTICCTLVRIVTKVFKNLSCKKYVNQSPVRIKSIRPLWHRLPIPQTRYLIQIGLQLLIEMINESSKVWIF